MKYSNVVIYNITTKNIFSYNSYDLVIRTWVKTKEVFIDKDSHGDRCGSSTIENILENYDIPLVSYLQLLRITKGNGETKC